AILVARFPRVSLCDPACRREAPPLHCQSWAPPGGQPSGRRDVVSVRTALCYRGPQYFRERRLRKRGRFERQGRLRPSDWTDQAERHLYLRVSDLLPIQSATFTGADRIERHHGRALTFLDQFGYRPDRVDFEGDVQHHAETRRFVLQQWADRVDRMRHDQWQAAELGKLHTLGIFPNRLGAYEIQHLGADRIDDEMR